MMKTPMLLRPLIFLLCALTTGVMTAAAREPVVVELFTSQSCYSCPPAEQYLSELADDPDLVTLEWHVDYWDTLVYGNQGRWKDPFSSYDYTLRQRQYNRSIKGVPNAYTPQAVVQGTYETVGSDRNVIPNLIRQAMAVETGLAATVSAGDVVITLGASEIAQGRAGVWLVRFLKEQVTEVRRGENAGKTLASRHVVRSVERLGTWDGVPVRFTAPAPAAGDGCAILVQRPEQGRILSARYCE